MPERPLSAEAEQLERAIFEMKKVIVGQDRAIERLMVCLLAGGHALLEGVPGLAKTLAAETLATVVGGTFARLQFTPDLLPADLMGTRIYRASSESFDVELGPVFVNFVLADEINRAPAKVQSALLEVMAEHQVSIGGKTFPVPQPFLVLATQNPIESEGVYPLPEAQRDRFLMKIVIGYPTAGEEVEIVYRMGVNPPEPTEVLGLDDLTRLQTAADEVYVDRAVVDYAVTLVLATRYPENYTLSDIAPLITYGASPRASLGLVAAGRALALLRGRRYALPQDVFDVAPDVLRHRLVLSYEALAQGVSADQILVRVLSTIPAPHVSPSDSPRPVLAPAPSAPPPAPQAPPSEGLAFPPRRRSTAPTTAAPEPDVSLPPPSAPMSTSGNPEHILRRLDLLISRRLDGLLHGEYLGLVPGHGSELGETREYQAGDDVRRIDWNVTARMQQPHVRETIADRELETWLLLDLSPSLDFGTALCEKRDLAISAGAAAGFLTARTGNRIGAVLLSPNGPVTIPARGGKDHLMALLHRLLTAPRVEAGTTAFADGIRRLAVSSRRRGLAVVISDFLDGDTWHQPLRQLGARHETLCVEVVDPRELELPAVGVLQLVDPRTGDLIDVQTSNPRLRERYAAAADEQRAAIATGIKGAGAEHLQLRTDRDWLMDLVRYVAGRRDRIWGRAGQVVK